MLILCSNIDWIAIGSIATAFAALFSFILILITWWQVRTLKIQRLEDSRARLSFSILSWNSIYLLCISNVGKETAYNIKLNVEGEPIEKSVSQWIKNMWKYITSHPFNIAPNASKYYYLAPIGKSNGYIIRFPKTGEEISSDTVKEWLNKYSELPINLYGTYCNGKYKFKENICISDYSNYGIVVEDAITLELKKLNEKFSRFNVCRSSFTTENNK